MSTHIPPTSENRDLLAFVEKLKAKDRFNRYNVWLKTTTGYPTIERHRAIAAFHYDNFVRLHVLPRVQQPSSS